MDKSKKVKQWMKKNHRAINILIAVLGGLVYYVGLSIAEKNEVVAEILMQIGMALVTNAILLFFSLLYFKEDEDYDNAKEIYEEKGLINIYESKKGINDKINREYLPKHRVHEYDILCCGGLTTLRKEEGSKLLEYIKKKKMRIRILTANPHVDYLLQQKIDEESELTKEVTYKTTPIENTSRQSIFELYEWVCEKRKELPEELKNNLEIRFYNSLPPLQLHRVENHIFVGQSVIGSNSQSSPTFEYVDSGNPGDFYSRYVRYFESLWDDPNFAQNKPGKRLNPQLIINDNIINSVLKLSCADIASDVGITNDNRIRAVFTVCGYPKPLIDGRKRRYNTNIVRGDEVCSIQQSNGALINGNKIGYYADDEEHVVGRAIKTKEQKFEVTKIIGKYTILVIPLMNSDEEVVATVSYEFDDDFNGAFGVAEETGIGEDISKSNVKIINKAKKWASLLAIYLGIKE